jgi:hypothetical protein
MAESEARRALGHADRGFVVERVQTGLSSGEGLISAVRDRVTNEGKDGEPVVVDEGVGDKRLLAVEPEFARVLRVAGRDGNTLSPQLRMAWDAPEVMQTLTRSSPLRASAPHIGVVGHITPTELRAELTRTDAANGFANRFLWVLVEGCASCRAAGTLTGRPWRSSAAGWRRWPTTRGGGARSRATAASGSSGRRATRASPPTFPGYSAP